LRSRIKEHEPALGRKSLETNLYRIIMEKASDEYRVKKNWRSRVKVTEEMIHSYFYSIKSACELIGFSRQAYYKDSVNKAELADRMI